MPKGYEEIRDSLIARGYSEKDAKRIAAATWNKHHPNAPVGRGYDQKSGIKPPPPPDKQ